MSQSQILQMKLQYVWNQTKQVVNNVFNHVSELCLFCLRSTRYHRVCFEPLVLPDLAKKKKTKKQ